MIEEAYISEIDAFVAFVVVPTEFEANDDDDRKPINLTEKIE